MININKIWMTCELLSETLNTSDMKNKYSADMTEHNIRHYNITLHNNMIWNNMTLNLLNICVDMTCVMTLHVFVCYDMLFQIMLLCNVIL